MLLAHLVFALVGALPFSMQVEDQFEKKRIAREIFDGRPVVMIAGDSRETSKEIGTWAAAIETKWGNALHVVGLANLDSLPFFVPNGAVRSNIQEEHPKMIVVCDWDGDLFEHLGLRAGIPNVIVWDAKGEKLGTVTGGASEGRTLALAKLLSTVTSTSAPR